MPGYILHLTEAKLIIKELEADGYTFSGEWINRFFLGTLLPDTKRKREKITSHFWNPSDLVLQAIAPNLTIFLEKYRSCLDTPVMLGYLAHLDLDACFVNSFWPSMWDFLDERQQVQTLQEKIRLVRLKKDGTLIPVSDFFSSAYYYGDYSRMNAYLLHRYQLKVPSYDPLLECPVAEVQVQDLQQVLQELQHLCSTVHPGAEQELAVFDLPSLEDFIRETARQMADALAKLLQNSPEKDLHTEA